MPLRRSAGVIDAARFRANVQTTSVAPVEDALPALDFERPEEDARAVRLRALAFAFLTALAAGLVNGSAAVVSESTICSIDLHSRNGNLDCAVALPGVEVTLSGSLTSTVSVHGGEPTSFAYDSLGRLVRAETGGSTTSYEYDAAGRLVQRVDPSGGVTRYEYDAAREARLRRRHAPRVLRRGPGGREPPRLPGRPVQLRRAWKPRRGGRRHDRHTVHLRRAPATHSRRDHGVDRRVQLRQQRSRRAPRPER